MGANMKAAAPSEPSIFAPLAGRKVSKVTWLVPGRFPNASLSLIEGRKGLGKSTLMAAICAMVTGGPMLPGCKRQNPAHVIWLGAEEDTESQILPRLKAAGADMKRVHGPQRDKVTGRMPMLRFPGDLAVLEEGIESLGVRVVVMDPWQSYADVDLDLNQEQHARSVLEPLADLASRTGCAFLLARHLRKGTHGHALEQGMGSVAIGNVCRSVCRLDEHPDVDNFVCLSVVACNLSEKAQTLVYQIIKAPGGERRIKWEGVSALDAATLAEGGGDAGSRDVLSDAIHLLRTTIKNDWVAVNTIFAEAKDALVGERTLRSAKAQLRCQRRKRTASGKTFWEWGPPLGGWPPML